MLGLFSVSVNKTIYILLIVIEKNNNNKTTELS